MERHSQIEDEAAARLARRDSGQWSDEDEARLGDWIRESTAHRVAYLRLKATWDMAARLRAVRAGVSSATSEEVPLPGEWRQSPYFERTGAGHDTDNKSGAGAVAAARRRILRLGLAAAVLLTLGAGIFLYSSDFLRQDRYVTAVGVVTSIPLKDGTSVTLNTASKIRVEMTGTVRRVELSRGEAFFDVAQDATRPFIVQAGDRTITVLGTKFSVRHEVNGVRIIVVEGRVAVSSPEPFNGGALVLTAGDSVRTADHRLVVRKRQFAEAEDALSWRSGYLVFHETTLADAVTEFNRYNTRRIVIGDERLARIRISGTFRTTQYEAFVRVLGEGFAIHSRDDGGDIVLSQAP